MTTPAERHAPDPGLAVGADRAAGADEIEADIERTRLRLQGTVDAIATDHAPHEPAIKDVEFDKAPFGILGFDTALGLTLEQLVHTGKISLMRMVELFTTGPARVLGKQRKLAVGEPGDITIFSTDRNWAYKVADTASKSRNSPFDGRTFKGGPVATIVAGKFAHKP